MEGHPRPPSNFLLTSDVRESWRREIAKSVSTSQQMLKYELVTVAEKVTFWLVMEVRRQRCLPLFGPFVVMFKTQIKPTSSWTLLRSSEAILQPF